MTEPYRMAEARIATGAWTVDAATGTVLGSTGPIGYRHSNGYVQLSMKASRRGPCHRVYAHRVIWEHVHGPIADGMQVNHINGVKHDNRITNLELVTGSENMRHAFDTGLATATRGTCNPNATLTEEDVVAIRRARADGQPQRVVAERFGIHEEHVGRIARRVAWPHVA